MIMKELTSIMAITAALIMEVPLTYMAVEDIVVICRKVLATDCLTIMKVIIITIMVELTTIFAKVIVETLEDIILGEAIINVSINVAGVDRLSLTYIMLYIW